MAEISVILPLDGTKTQFKAFRDSLAALDDQVGELVVVRTGATEIDDEDLGSLPATPVIVDAEGSLGALWDAGIAASTCEYVYPASCRIRFSKAFYRVLAAQATRMPVDMLFFHLQEFDLSTQRYTSRRLSSRISPPAEPFQASQHAARIVQRLSANASSAVYARRFIDQQGFSFSSVASFDDDPGLPLLIARAGSISRLPWPLAVLAFDSETMFDEVGHDAFLARYDVYHGLYTDGLPLDKMFESVLEWSVSFATRLVPLAPSELGERMLDAMAADVLPVVGDHIQSTRGALLYEGVSTLLLSPLSRMELLETIGSLRELEGEERYRAEMLQIMLKRANAGAPEATRPRKKGLFRR